MQYLDMLGAEDGADPASDPWRKRWNLSRTVGAIAVGTVAALLWPARRVTAGLLGAVAAAAGGLVGGARRGI